MGRRVALNPTSRGIAMVRHLLAADGGNPDDSELIARSLSALPGSWFHAGEWGRNRNELLSDPNVWTRATTNAFLPPTGSIS
jgi:hypothetical protein